MTEEIELRCVARRDGYGKWVLHIEGLRDILRDAEEGVEKSGGGGVVGSRIGELQLRLLGRRGDAPYPERPARKSWREGGFPEPSDAQVSEAAEWLAPYLTDARYDARMKIATAYALAQVFAKLESAAAEAARAEARR